MTCTVLAGVSRTVAAELRAYCTRDKAIELLRVVHDGQQLLDCLERTRPEVVVLDLLLPILDGLAVLERLADLKLSPRPRVIVLSPIFREALTQRLAQLADYCLLKPFSVDVLATRIHQFAFGTVAHLVADSQAPLPELHLSPPGHALTVARLLRHVGVPAHTQGYRYLSQAVELVVDKPALLQAMTKEVYPVVARTHTTTAARVERSMRHAVEVAWSRGDLEELHRLFGNAIDRHRGRPSNSEFIAVLAETLRIATGRQGRREVT